MTEPDARLARAIERIDAINADDPHDKELLYSQRMTAWLDRLEPSASDALRIAVRAQHVGRWRIPRDRYPKDRKGYHLWRTELGKMHADLAAEVVRDVGYDDETAEAVRRMLTKRKLKTDPEVQTLEDVACLVFLEHYFPAFAADHDDDKVVRILQKTWNKMSERGHQAALGLTLPEREKKLVQRALTDG